MQLLRSSREDLPPFAFPTHEALREARALGPAVAADAVAALLAAYEPGGDHALAARAAGLVPELRLELAIPSLVGCVARLPEDDPLRLVSAAVLDLLGPERFSPLLEAFARSTDPAARWRIGMSLCVAPQGTSGVRVALESLLETDPAGAASLLAEHGDRAALPALRATLDRLDFPSPDLDELTALERLTTVGHAIRALRGNLRRSQREKVDRADARYDALVESGLLPVDPPPGSCSRH
jgi:hypothetical protein